MKPALMARAVMEGVTLGLAYGLERMQELGISPAEIRLTGGGSKSAVWRQICADIFNCPVVTLAESEGAALGAAIPGVWLPFKLNKSVADWAAEIVKTNPSERVEPEKQLCFRLRGGPAKTRFPDANLLSPRPISLKDINLCEHHHSLYSCSLSLRIDRRPRPAPTRKRARVATTSFRPDGQFEHYKSPDDCRFRASRLTTRRPFMKR